MPLILIDTNPKTPIGKGVGHDGAVLPWVGDVLIMDFMVNKAQGLPVLRVDPIWSADSPVWPNSWPLNGEMQGE
jgi:hypothetical protein